MEISNLFFFTIIEILYLFYIFIRFKTRINFNHPLEYYVINKLGDFFKHPISKKEYSNKICPFGHLAIKYFILYLIFRLVFLKFNVNIQIVKNINFYIFALALLLSLLNMNALIYLIPFIMFDYYFFNFFYN